MSPAPACRNLECIRGHRRKTSHVSFRHVLTSAPLSGSPPAVPRVVPSDLLERRPDVAAAERRMQRENAAIGVAGAALYPNVHLTAAGGIASSNLGDLFRADSLTWGLGGNVAAPLLDGGRRRAAVDEVRARYEEVAADYRSTLGARYEAMVYLIRALGGGWQR